MEAKAQVLSPKRPKSRLMSPKLNENAGFLKPTLNQKKRDDMVKDKTDYVDFGQFFKP